MCYTCCLLISKLKLPFFFTCHKRQGNFGDLKCNILVFCSQGHGRLVQSLSTLYGKLLNREVNALNDVLVTCGAYEALFVAIQGYVERGDEVILIEPSFDSYEPMIKIAGGIPKYISLKPVSGRLKLYST